MSVKISKGLLGKINKHLEGIYPYEGTGYLLGQLNDEERVIIEIINIQNTWAESSQEDRFLISPQDSMKAEQFAEDQGLEIIGVFHSHPDGANQPSSFDREWALPWFSYLITTINKGNADNTRSWRLAEDRKSFIEEDLVID
jgi:proteasome lid subunit RPN8/RPN11